MTWNSQDLFRSPEEREQEHGLSVPPPLAEEPESDMAIPSIAAFSRAMYADTPRPLIEQFPEPIRNEMLSLGYWDDVVYRRKIRLYTRGITAL